MPLWSVWERVCLCDVSLCSPRRSYQPSLLLYRALCCDVMLALCVSWVCVVNPVCLAASCQQTAMATGEASKSPFDLDVATLFKIYITGDDADVQANRLALNSWFRRHTTAKPEVVFNDDGFKVGGKEVYWGDLAVAWDDGRDGVFTFLGVEVDVSDQAMAWRTLVKLLKPGTSPPCPLLLPLVAPVSPLWPSRFA